LIKLLTNPPEALPVLLDQIKAHLRITHDDDDNYLIELAEAAIALVEARTGKSLITQGWRVFLDQWPESGIVELPVAPLREVSAITVYDYDGNPLTVSPDSWFADTVSDRPRIVGSSMFYSYKKTNGFEIDVVCGFGDTGADVPDLLIRSILIIIAHWYEFRGAPGDPALHGLMPKGFDRLAAPYCRINL
jgi:uncharacterized phiE125 gp8 family phage protein